MGTFQLDFSNAQYVGLPLKTVQSFNWIKTKHEKIVDFLFCFPWKHDVRLDNSLVRSSRIFLEAVWSTYY